MQKKDLSVSLKRKDQEDKEKVLSQYIPLVQSVAEKMAMAIGFPKSVEIQDLISTGVIGLVEAFSNFDPDHGVKFETYAVPRIRGAILDELRSLDWVPRSTRAKSREIDRALTKLENKLGRIPTDKELAKFLKMPVRKLHSARGDLSSSIVLSLDDLVYKEEDNRQIPRIETIEASARENILNDLEKKELKAFLVSAIKHLSEQERLVIALYYFEELTLKKISEIMAISESRVSKIYTKAVMKLRSMIQEKFALSDKEPTEFLKNYFHFKDSDKLKVSSVNTSEASIYPFFSHEDYKTLLKSLAMVNKLLDKSLESINSLYKQRTKTVAEVKTILEYKN